MEEMRIENEVTTEETLNNEETTESNGTLGTVIIGTLIGVGIVAGEEIGKFALNKVLKPGAKKFVGLFKNRKKNSKEETNEDDYLYDENDEFEKADE